MGKNRTTNMEKYYGFRIKIEDAIDPVSAEIVRLKANKYFIDEGLKKEDYLIYFHSIIIISDTEHFGFLNGLSERAEEISIHYSVNPKQEKNGDIKFINYYFEEIEGEGIINQYADKTMIGFNILSKYFEQNPQFKSYIITFIRKNMRADHRKIKLSVTARPTMRYRTIVETKNLMRTTMKDLSYDRPIQLDLPYNPPLAHRSGATKMNEDKPNFPSIQIIGAVGTVNANSGGQNVSINAGNLDDIVKDLRKLSGILSSSTNPDEEALQTVEDAIVLSRKEDPTRLNEMLKQGGTKLLGHAEKIGAKALELYIKSLFDS